MSSLCSVTERVEQTIGEGAGWCSSEHFVVSPSYLGTRGSVAPLAVLCAAATAFVHAASSRSSPFGWNLRHLSSQSAPSMHPHNEARLGRPVPLPSVQRHWNLLSQLNPFPVHSMAGWRPTQPLLAAHRIHVSLTRCSCCCVAQTSHDE